MVKKHGIVKSFSYAFSGLGLALKEESNFKIHFIATLFVIFLGYFLDISATEWIFLTLVTGLVYISELFNTAIETTVDLASNEVSEKAKVAKDVSAAAVLLTSIVAFIVGVLIFLPKILFLLGL